jgi:hypothetical protein
VGFENSFGILSDLKGREHWKDLDIDRKIL